MKAEKNLRELLKKIATREKCEESFIITPVSTGGANYSSELYAIELKKDDGNKLDLFAKVAVINEAMREMIDSDEIYTNELFVYEELFPTYEELMNKFKIHEDERPTYSKYYGSSNEIFNEILILENLTTKGYILYDRMKSVDWKYAKASMDDLAKFHALSLIYKAERPEEFKDKTKGLINLMAQDSNAKFQVWLNSMISTGRVTLKGQTKVKMDKFLESFNQTTFKKLSQPRKCPVIVHADYRPSNILVKYKGDTVESLIPLDFQGIHLGTPVVDILYFVVLGTDKQFRKEHLKNLIDNYYNTFSHFLRLAGLDPNVIYPRQDFDQEYKECLPMGLYIALMILPTVTVHTDEAAKPGDLEHTISIKGNDVFEKRFTELVDDFTEWGVL